MKKRIIAMILAITTLAAIFAVSGNAYQMGGPQYFTNPIGTRLYRIHLWNDDPYNPSTSEPYTVHADMDNLASYYSFAVIFASVKRYNYSLSKYVDEEKNTVINELKTNGVLYDWSVSGICDSVGDTVEDDYTDDSGRDTVKKVYACGTVVFGELGGSCIYYKVYPGGGIQSRTYFTYSGNPITFNRKWD